MINFFFYLFIFCFIHLVIFSYGLQVKKIFLSRLNFSIGELGILGFLTTYIIVTSIHFITNISLNVTLLFYFFGIIFFLRNLDCIKLIISSQIKIILYIIFFSVLASITKQFHDDTYLYHLPTINYFQQSKIVFGVHGIFDVLAYGHGFYNIMSIFQFPLIKNSAIYFVPIVFFNFFVLICYDLFKKSNNTFLNLFLIVIFLIFCFRYNRFSTFGGDLAPLIIIFLLQIYLIDFFKQKNFINLEKFVIFFTFGLLLKIYVISSIFLSLAFILILKKKIFLILKKKSLQISFLLLFVGLLNNFIQSGCLIYPLSASCFKNDIVFWGIGKKTSSEREAKQVAEAKGIKSYIRLSKLNENKKNYNLDIEPKEYLQKFKYSYLKYVLKDPDHKRLLVILFIVILLFCMLFFFKNKNNKEILLTNQENSLIKVIASLSFLSWLVIGPQSRYGGNAYLSFFLFAIFFANSKINIKVINKNLLSFVFILGISFFSGKNLIRFYKEYQSQNNSDKFLFSTFKNIPFTTKKQSFYVLHYADHNLGCGNISFPCILSDYKYVVEETFKKNNYLFLKSNDNFLIENIKKEHIKFNILWNNG